VRNYLADGGRVAARALGAARFVTMPEFDGPAFLHEFAWLMPQSKIKGFYRDRNGGNGEYGHDVKTVLPIQP